MWYPPQQQQQCWHGYNIHPLSPQHRTSYYCSTDESSSVNRATTYALARTDENESFAQYQPTPRADDVYVTGTDYYVTTSTGSYGDEMSSLPYQNPTTQWNPVIAAPTKTSIITNSIQENPITTNTPSSSACWDWLLYPPEIYSNLYIPSSSFVQHSHQQDDDLDLLASLPTWLLGLLYPSMKQIHNMDDENDSDQEISSLNQMPDEPKINHVSSNLSLSSENIPNGQKLQENRSSTPDTDDGYQSASDASRSDYSHHQSKDDLPKRISYAAAVKPMATSINNKISPLPTSLIKPKNNSSNDILNNNNGQKLKFIAPRFERMHHAKQYPSSTTTTTTTMIKDSSSSSSLTNHRTQMRSNNTYHQRNHMNNSTRRR